MATLFFLGGGGDKSGQQENREKWFPSSNFRGFFLPPAPPACFYIISTNKNRNQLLEHSLYEFERVPLVRLRPPALGRVPWWPPVGGPMVLAGRPLLPTGHRGAARGRPDLRVDVRSGRNRTQLLGSRRRTKRGEEKSEFGKKRDVNDLFPCLLLLSSLRRD